MDPEQPEEVCGELMCAPWVAVTPGRTWPPGPRARGGYPTENIPLPAAMPPLSPFPGDTAEPGGRAQPSSGDCSPCPAGGVDFPLGRGHIPSANPPGRTKRPNGAAQPSASPTHPARRRDVPGSCLTSGLSKHLPNTTPSPRPCAAPRWGSRRGFPSCVPGMLLQRLRSPYLLPRCSKRRREPGGPAAAAAPLLPTHRSTRDCERGRPAGLYRRAFPLAPADSRNRILALRAVSSAAFGPVSAGKREGALPVSRPRAATRRSNPGNLRACFAKLLKLDALGNAAGREGEKR